MKIEVSIDTIDELARIFAVIRDKPLDDSILQGLTQQLSTSSEALKAAEAAAGS